MSWSFRIWRGSIDSDLLAAAMEVDVLALTRLGSVLVHGPAALILQRDHELLQTPTLRRCLNSLNCPVLVVR